MLADIAGYSALMERDEVRTFQRLQTLRELLIRPRVSEYGGRIIKFTGDGFLAVFPSATACLGCGVAIQRTNSAQEITKDEQERFHFRMGINLGDVIKDGDDISGDGVNVAARLEALAPLDGICISGAVRDQVREDLGVELEDLGEQKVKNITRPIRAYRIHVGVTETVNTNSFHTWKRRYRRVTSTLYLHRAVVYSQIVLIIVLIVFWFSGIISAYWPHKVFVPSEERIRSAATAAEIPLPSQITFTLPSFGVPAQFAKYVGAWSTGESRFNDRSRRAMVLVEKVDGEGFVEGEWAVSGPTPFSSDQRPAHFVKFFGKITNDGLGFRLNNRSFLFRMSDEDNMVAEVDGIGDSGLFHSAAPLKRLR
jgi:hypothetical protein